MTNGETDALRLSRPEIKVLMAKLEAIEWLWPNLETTRTRQDAVARQDGVRSTEVDQPLPIRPEAAGIAHRLAKSLDQAALAITSQRRVQYLPVPFSHAADFVGPLQPNESRVPRGYRETVEGRARWLHRHVVQLALVNNAQAHFADIVSAVEQAREVIDLPEESEFAGLCPQCQSRLYCYSVERLVRCKRCGSILDVQSRKEAAMAEARAVIGTPLELSRLLPALGGDKAIGYERVRYLAKTKRVTPRPSMDGIDRFNLGEVLDAHRLLAGARRNSGRKSRVA